VAALEADNAAVRHGQGQMMLDLAADKRVAACFGRPLPHGAAAAAGKADLADFRKRLILLRQEAMGQSATLRTNALEHTDDRGSEDDDGSDAFMRLQNLSQVDSHNKVIQQIDEALARIQEGTYGICEMCGQLIRKPRLMNLPFVRTCMECQSAMEENPTGIR
jgi:RNA polymerase-binding protein DksA